MQNNGSVYLHVLFAKAGMPVYADEPDYNENVVFGLVHSELEEAWDVCLSLSKISIRRSHSSPWRLRLAVDGSGGGSLITLNHNLPPDLVNFFPKPKNGTGVKLLSGESAPAPVVETGPREIISFFKPNMTIQLVTDHFMTYPRGSIPPQVGEAKRKFLNFLMQGRSEPTCCR